MESEERIKDIVREKYSEIASRSGSTSCCGSTSQREVFPNLVVDDYTDQQGYVAEADLGLGCGLPTAHARIAPGMTVLDLGSGAGNDVFIAARLVGEAGKVIGVDMTEEMIDLANRNREKTGIRNVEFRFGEIESLPVEDGSVDVVLSNCVLNLVPDKNKAFGEIFRVLRSGGHFTISDIVLEGELPPSLLKMAELYTGCVAGAMQKSDYIRTIEEAGFLPVTLEKESEIRIPEGTLRLLAAGLPEEELNLENVRILSVTLTSRKP